jgi:hypothetical protein
LPTKSQRDLRSHYTIILETAYALVKLRPSIKRAQIGRTERVIYRDKRLFCAKWLKIAQIGGPAGILAACWLNAFHNQMMIPRM